jgi:hypothetical protein
LIPVNGNENKETETDMIIALILNAVLAVGVVGAIVGHLAWSIATQHRDHGVVAAGPLIRRRIWARRTRPHAGSVRPLFVQARTGQPWPAA